MKYRMITTNYETGLLWSEEVGETVEENSINPMHLINVYPRLQYQEVKGFGGAFTEASAWNLSLLAEETREDVLRAYFSEEGLRYNLCRTHINSCDFSMDNYAYQGQKEDGSLTEFSIERDKKFLIPMIKQAQEMRGKEICLLASPWSPPAYMKTNGEMNHGGHLKEECYGMWADYLVKYVKAYADEGIRISMLTVQNEPQAVQTWDSCIYSSEEEQRLVRDYLGPKFEQEGLGHIKILIWDHNKELLYERTKEILGDEQAANYITGAGFHWYSGDHFEAIRLVREEFPELELYFTEGCVEYSRFGGASEVSKAEMYAHDMIGNFEAGMNGYIDWNLLLNQEGGPNHVGNFCDAPLMCNMDGGRLTKHLSYYYIGHISRYVKAGARKIATTKYTDGLDVVAFINPDGSRVVVILNKQDLDQEVSVKEYVSSKEISGMNLVVANHSIVTICMDEKQCLN